MVCSGAAAAMVPLPKGALVGAASGRRYSSLERVLEPGETLLCYTDGVTEAEDAGGAAFSERRCLEALRLGTATSLPVLLDSLYEQVVAHCGSRLLADDCTMLAVSRPAL
jgi:sigma-B regulation protein RsbU (phosphoserine phosphatase)